MKSNFTKWIAIAFVGAALTGLSGTASAGRWEDWRIREIHRSEVKIDDLRVQRDRADDRHDWRRVHRLDDEIAKLRELIRRDREELENRRHRDWDRDRRHDW